MPSANCFDTPTLKDYLLGKLSDEQSDFVAAHLEACLTCEATVSQLDRASDTLTNGLRLPVVAAEPNTDDELQRALEKVQSLERVDDHRETSEVSQTSEVYPDRSPVLRDYRLLEPLGSGGMGTVYKAVHTRLDRLVAVKLLPARRLGDEQAVARFQREMRVIGQLSHPAIVQATDAGEVDGIHFLVMEYVEGCDLNALAKACGPLFIADACEITRQAALGLEYAHQQGIVHRDIKPSNLMLDRGIERWGDGEMKSNSPNPPTAQSPHLKILDLGLALLSGVQAPVDELTTVGQLMGTLDYMAPEQLEDSHQVGPGADIYALAATLYRLLTGVAPFAKDDRKTPLQKLRALATQTVPPIRERRADIPPELASMIDRALRRDPSERFASMADFAAALAPWCAGQDLNKLVGQVANLPGPSIESFSARLGAPDPAAWLDRRSPSASRRTVKAEPHSRDLRSVAAARSGDSRRALDGQVENLPHVSSPRRTLLITLAVLFLAALGIVITIETNKGTLIVESLRDGVEVRVKKSGKPVEQLELTTGPKSARLAAGEYEIEILGDADGLQIQNGKFVLKRGDTVVAKVTEVPKGRAVVTKPESTEARPPSEPQPRKPIEIVDRNAKGMETFEASNPDLAGEKKVRDVLQTKITVDFVELPLTDVLQFLEDRTQIAFFLETKVLAEEGIALDSPITLSLKDKPTTTVLEFLLRSLHCAWSIDGGQVVITTASKVNDVLVTRTYPIGKLLPGVRQAVERLKSEPLQVSPNSAQSGGGLGGGFGGGMGGGMGGGFFHVSGTSSLVGTLPAILAQSGVGVAPAANPSQHHLFIPSETSHFQKLLSESLGHTWMDRDGEGGTCELLHNVLVVRNTRRAQADVESLLRTVETAFLKPLTEPVEIRPAGYSLEADANVRRQLARKFDVEFAETPLSDVASWLSDQLDVQVLIDREALAEVGVATDSPVTLRFQGIPGDVLLSRLLKPLQLTHDIEHGLLVLTTMQKQKDRLVTKVYDVRDLLDRGLHPSRLIAGLQTTTPGPWSETDGEGGTLTLFADTLLVVRQTWPSHDEVTKFLTSLRSQLSDQPEVPRVVNANPNPTKSDNFTTTRLNQPQPKGSAASNNPPTKPASDNQPRYDGKTFDEWLAILDTERSPTRLADAIEALRLLGRDTHAEQIAERVLKVSRVVDFEPVASGNNRPSVYAEVYQLFTRLPLDVVQRAYAQELRNGTTRSRKFVLTYLATLADKIVVDDFPVAVLTVSRDSDQVVRELAIKWLVAAPLEGKVLRLATDRDRRLREVLSDKSTNVAFLAARRLVNSEEDSKAVADVLARVVSWPDHRELRAEHRELRAEALSLLALMGPRASSVASKISPLLQDATPVSVRVGTAEHGFIQWALFADSNDHAAWRDLAAVVLARMGKDAAAELSKIQEAIDSQPATDRISVSDGASFVERLLAAKFRVEGQPMLDLKSSDLKLTANDVKQIAANFKLLRAEQQLFKQYLGEKHPTIREYEEKLKAASDEFSAASRIFINSQK